MAESLIGWVGLWSALILITTRYSHFPFVIENVSGTDYGTKVCWQNPDRRASLHVHGRVFTAIRPVSKHESSDRSQKASHSIYRSI